MERRPRIADRTHPPSEECCELYAKQPRCGLCIWGFGVWLTLLIVNKTGKAPCFASGDEGPLTRTQAHSRVSKFDQGTLR